MTAQENQPFVVGIQDSLLTDVLVDRVKNTQELPKTQLPTGERPTSDPQEPDALKSFARALMVSLTWSLAGLSKRKGT